MPLYSYKAVDKTGAVIEETIQAANRQDVANVLKSDDLNVLTVKNLNSNVGAIFGSKISVAEKAVFCRFLGTMLRSGLSLHEAVQILGKESKNKKMREILSNIAFQTRKGQSLSVTLSKYKDVFDPVFLTMVKAGEESGTLDKSLDYLSKQLMARHELTQKIKGSLMYPAVVISAMAGVGVLMVVFVLPQISSVFLKMNIDMPWTTRLILNFGNLVGDNIAVFLISLVLLAALIVIFFSARPTKKIFYNLLGEIPLVREIMNQVDVAQFARTLATLLKSGVPITEALNVSSDSLSQPRLRQQAKGFSESVSKGKSLSDILGENKQVFPAIMVQTIKTGEKTGTLEEVLKELADFYESEVEHQLKRLTSLLEPVLMLVVGIIVGAMVIMIIAPIYSIIGNLETSMKK